MTATRREPGLDGDQSQARTGRFWMLKPGAIGAMTAVLDVPMQRRQKLSGPKGLTGDCRHDYRHDGKPGRNMYLGRRTTVSGTSHVDFGGVPVTARPPLIATIDAMHATGMESSRFRYDDLRFERYHAADRKTLQDRRVAGLVAPRLHIRQEDREGASIWFCQISNTEVPTVAVAWQRSAAE